MGNETTPLDKVKVDPEIVALLPKYIRRRVSDVASIKILLARSDIEEIRRLAHNMRGSGLAYGLQRVTDIGAAMEEAALSSDTNRIVSLTQQLEEYISQLR